MITNTALLTAATTTGAGNAYQSGWANRVFYAKGTTSSGSGAATIKIQAALAPADTWVDLGTITLTLGTTETADGFASNAAWTHIRANVTAISGTGASVSAVMASEALA